MDLSSDNKFAYIDFEFFDSQEPNLELVCATVMTDQKPVEYWLLYDATAKVELSDHIKDLHAQGYVFVAHAVTAEARAFLSLGLDPMQFRWYDTLVEFRLLCNHNDEYAYGKKILRNQIVYTTSPKVRREAERAKSLAARYEGWVPDELKPAMAMDSGVYEQPKFDLGSSVYTMTGKAIDSARKKEMRDVILSKSLELLEFHKPEIMEYCTSDVEVLLELQAKLTQANYQLYGTTVKESQLRAEFCAAMAVVESNGIPLDLGIVDRIAKARPEIMMDSWVKANEATGLPLFWPLERPLGRKGQPLKKPIGVLKYDQFAAYITACGKRDEWPRTEPTARNPKGRLSLEGDVLDRYRHYDGIEAIRNSKKLQRDLGWLDPNKKVKVGESGFYQSIGSDGHIRTYFGPYITQSGRNAPKAKTFPLAMSSWIRTIMRPKEGWLLSSIDWRAQEIAIAAQLSGDKNYRGMYEASDPYVYFACLSGAIPWEDEPVGKKKYPEIRNAYKAIVLGIGYGKGVKSLAETLTQVTDEEWTEEKTQVLLDKHRSVFQDYWAWADSIWEQTQCGKPVDLGRGWYMGPDNPNPRSVKNAPVQGWAAAMLRETVVEGVKQGLRIIAPLHDAVYLVHKTPEELETMIDIMDQSVRTIMGDKYFPIGTEAKTITAEEYYVEEKGADMFERFKHLITGEKK